MWMVVGGLVPTVHAAITTFSSERDGRKYKINPVMNRDTVDTRRVHYFNMRGFRLYSISLTHVEVFKRNLDIYFQVPDQPDCD